MGRIYATPGALALDVDLSRYLRRHHCGDWGEELCAEDKQANEDALDLRHPPAELLPDARR